MCIFIYVKLHIITLRPDKKIALVQCVNIIMGRRNITIFTHLIKDDVGVRKNINYDRKKTYLELDRLEESFLPACKLGKSFWRFLVSRHIR